MMIRDQCQNTSLLAIQLVKCLIPFSAVARLEVISCSCRSSTKLFGQWNQHRCFLVIYGEPGHMAASGTSRGRNSGPAVPAFRWRQLQHPGQVGDASFCHRIQGIRGDGVFFSAFHLHSWVSVLLFVLHTLTVHLCNFVFQRSGRADQCVQCQWWGPA